MLIRNWVLQMAGIIVLGSICDSVMSDGEMKKYVKLVVGLILTFTVIRPLVNFPSGELKLEVPEPPRSTAMEYHKSLDEENQQSLMRTYCLKLAQKAEEMLRRQWNISAEVFVGAEETDEARFGSVNWMRVEIPQGTAVNCEEIEKKLSEEFGVEPGKVETVLR